MTSLTHDNSTQTKQTQEKCVHTFNTNSTSGADSSSASSETCQAEEDDTVKIAGRRTDRKMDPIDGE